MNDLNRTSEVSVPGKMTPEGIDYVQWGRRWDTQQSYLVVRREERFGVMLDLAVEVLGRAPQRVLDLGCGTGDLARRVLDRFPTAEVVGVDADPLLLAIANGAVGDAGGRARWVQADLRDKQWAEPLEVMGGFDLAVSSTALHWLPTACLVSLYHTLFALLEPGGVFSNADVIPPLKAGRLATAADSLRSREAQRTQATTSGERYAEWWEAVEREPEMAALWRERAQVFEDHPEELELPSAEEHLQSLRHAGFLEAAVMWRFFDYAVLGAVKAV